MIITGRRWYGRYGEQHARGRFLMVFNNYTTGTPRELRAAVRNVHLRQSGHFMTGFCVLTLRRGQDWIENGYTPRASQRVFVSGTYGHDGLPIDVDASYVPGFWEALVPLPPELVEKFWSGGGHNSAGTEAMDMFTWAQGPELKKPLITREPSPRKQS